MNSSLWKYLGVVCYLFLLHWGLWCWGAMGRGELWELGLIPVGPRVSLCLGWKCSALPMQAGSGAGFIFTQHKHSMSEVFPLFEASMTA